MLMSLGLFSFSLQTAPYQTLKRATEQRWAKLDRVGIGAAWQWTGPGEDRITIEGTLAPGITGDTGTLDKLRSMAADGKAWILTAGNGTVMGAWIIDDVEETQSHIRTGGNPRRVAFSLTLHRYWDRDAASMGKLMDSKP